MTTRALDRVERLSVSSIFLVLGGLSGVFFVVLCPPLNAFDEHEHFRRAYQIAEGNLFSDKVTVPTPTGTATGYGGLMPADVEQTIERLDLGHADSAYDYGLVGDEWESPSEAEGLIPRRFDNTAMYSPAGYAPQSTAIAIARVLGLPPVTYLYLAPLAGLFAWLAMMFAAIRIAPYGRWIFLVVALNPLAVWQAATFAPDASGAAFIALAMAALMRLRSGPQLRRPGLVTAVLVLSLLATVLIKVSYLPLATLMFLAPKDVVRPVARWAVFGAVTAVGGTWNMVALPFGQGSAEFHNLTKGVVDTHGQIEYILSHPLEFSGMLLKSVFGSESAFWGSDYVVQLSYTELPPWVSYAWLGLLAYAVLLRPRPPAELREVARWPWVPIALAAISASIVIGALYVGWTYVGNDFIMGIQRRYWIPLTFLLIPALAQVPRWLFEGSRRNLITIAVAGLILGTAVVSVYADFQGQTI